MKKYIPKIEFIKYGGQFQIGLTFTIHTHCVDEETEKYHFHIWLDLGLYCIELTIGERFL